MGNPGRYVVIFLAFVIGLIAVSCSTEEKQERPIPVIASVEAKPKVVKAREAIPLTITISNALPSSVYYSTFSLAPNDWNGETCNVYLIDIYRDGKEGNLYLERPRMDVPVTVSGMGRREIKAGGKIEIQIDARKWKLRDDWLPGKYRVTIRVDNLEVDKHSILSILTDPVEFEIK
jgi:hypothetical protein